MRVTGGPYTGIYLHPRYSSLHSSAVARHVNAVSLNTTSLLILVCSTKRHVATVNHSFTTTKLGHRRPHLSPVAALTATVSSWSYSPLTAGRYATSNAPATLHGWLCRRLDRAGQTGYLSLVTSSSLAIPITQGWSRLNRNAAAKTFNTPTVAIRVHL